MGASTNTGAVVVELPPQQREVKEGYDWVNSCDFPIYSDNLFHLDDFRKKASEPTDWLMK